MKLIAPDPRIVEHSAEMAKVKRRRERKDYLKRNALTIIPILISFLALVVSIIGTLSPRMEQVCNLHPQRECQQCDCQHLQEDP